MNFAIPAGRTSTVMFMSGSSPQGGYTRSLSLAFYGYALVLPSGLSYVDDLLIATGGFES